MLATAVVMLTWHNVWMAQHGKAMSDELQSAGRDVQEGRKPLFALAVVVGAAVLREGSEVVLFLYGVAISDGGSAWSLALGDAPDTPDTPTLALSLPYRPDASSPHAHPNRGATPLPHLVERETTNHG